MMRMMPRRRVLTLLAASAALAPGLSMLPARDSRFLFEWTGTALGTRVRLRVAHEDQTAVRRAVELAAAEIDRLENIFSLFRPESELSRLNHAGDLWRPSLDLVILLQQAAAISSLSSGAFDVTVQPLWQLFADHFARAPLDQAGPPPSAVDRTRALVDFRGVEAGPARVALAKPGMAVTLNGVAQGYITDRVADLLRGQGFAHVLVDLGEIRALGRPPTGTAWPVHIVDPRDDGRTLAALLLSERAVATSQGRAASFDGAGRCHHLFDPATGHSAQRYLSVTVAADRAATADALSTALSIMPPDRAAALIAQLAGVEAWMLTTQGEMKRLSGARAG